jgi:hypothetical protein
MPREHPDFISIGRLSGCVGWAAVVMRGLETHLVAGAFNSSFLHPVGFSNESKDYDPFPAAPWTIAADSKRQHPQPLTDTTHTLTLTLFIRSGALCSDFAAAMQDMVKDTNNMSIPVDVASGRVLQNQGGKCIVFASQGPPLLQVKLANALTCFISVQDAQASTTTPPPPFPANS